MNLTDIGLTAIGADEAAPPSPRSIDVARAWQLLGMVAVPLSAYHGYKRNNSVGWAIGWALLGGAFPVVALPVAVAQGFGKRKT